MHFGEIIVCASLLMYSVSGSALHGPCSSNGECGTLDTICRNSTCTCRQNFSVKEDTCVHLATPRLHCKTKHDCKVLGARSLCTKAFLCACSPFHHMHNNSCVKNRDLDEVCQHDHQCYCGADCEQKIACLDKRCSCKNGFKPSIRRCLVDMSYAPILMDVSNSSEASVILSSSVNDTILPTVVQATSNSNPYEFVGCNFLFLLAIYFV